jgi:hypothetical protein
VYGQKFSANGTRLWADSGRAIKPLGAGQPSFIRCFAKDSSAVAYFLELQTATTHLVKGFRVDRNGNLLWGGSVINVCARVSGKGRLTGAFTASGNSLLTWADNRLDGNGVYAQQLNFTGQLGILTDVKRFDDAAPQRFSLEQNYPNPFNPSTKIRFTVPQVGTGHAPSLLKVYDILGREVATLVHEEKPAGTYEINFDATKLSSGVYFYRLQAAGFVETKRMILMR